MEANSARIGVIPTPPAMSSTSRRVLRRLRAEQPLLPVVFLAARGAVADGIAGLTAGGDDYVTKLFSLEDVAARMRALRRRMNREVADDGLLVVGDLTLDENRREVTRAG